MLYQSIRFERDWRCGLKLQMLYRASVTFSCQGTSREQKFKPLQFIQFIQYILHCAGKKPVLGEGNPSLCQATRKILCQAQLRNVFLLPLLFFVFGFWWFFFWSRGLSWDFKQIQMSFCIYIYNRVCNQSIASVLAMLAEESLIFLPNFLQTSCFVFLFDI